jgi:predicted permease
MHPTIVGIAPASFTGLEVGRTFDVVAPICSEPAWHGANVRLDSGLAWWLTVIGRLKPGVTFEQAADVLRAHSPGVFEATVPANYPPASVGPYRTMRLVALSASHGLSRLRAQYAASLRLLFGVTALVLIIASVNLAHLTRARASDRHHEMAVRRSLGASGFRLAQQFFAESILLTAAGVLVGAWLARALCRLLIALLASDASSVFLGLSMDWRTVSFMTLVATAAVLVSGSVPLLHVMRAEPARALTLGRQSVNLADAAWLRRTLLSSQMAFSLVLLAAALVFARSLQNLEALAPGFQPRNVVVADINFADLQLPSANAMTFRHDLLERIRTNPDVAAASETLILPVASGNWNNRMWLDGADRNTAQVVSRNMIGTTYFRTLSTPVVSGREFDERDLAAGAAKVAIVNERFVRQFGLDLDAVGRHFRIETNQLEPEASYEIVGVVQNTKYHDLREADQPIVYVPLSVAARRRPAGQLLVRGSTTADRAAAALKATLRDTNVRYTLRRFESIIQGTLVRERLMAAVAVPFGILAALLTAVGLYGVFASRVARRTQEIGIRIALGATAAGIMVSVLRETVVVLTVGIICGALLTAAASRAASALLFGVTTSDPLSLAAAAAALSAIALLAAYLPARRAARIDPIVALRAE